MRFFQTSNSEPEEGAIFLEVWSDAARAASAAARRARAGGRDWRKAARSEYASHASGAKAIGASSRRMADTFTIHRALGRPKQAERVKRTAKRKLGRFGPVGQKFFQTQFA